MTFVPHSTCLKRNGGGLDTRGQTFKAITFFLKSLFTVRFTFSPFLAPRKRGDVQIYGIASSAQEWDRIVGLRVDQVFTYEFDSNQKIGHR